MSVIIIGGSLVGLTLALACAGHGISTVVLEREHMRREGGTLGIDRGLLMRTIGQGIHGKARRRLFPVLAGRRQVVAWQELHGWLRAEVLSRDEIALEEGVSVANIVEDSEEVTASGSDGRQFHSQAIIGADGYRSFVRRRISPERLDAVYAGYALWRGLVPEGDLPVAGLPRDNEEAVLANEAGHRLVAYPVAGPGGSLVRGHRLLSFTWYDAGCSDLLRELNCIDSSGGILRSLSAERIPVTVGEGLCKLARHIWPEPWRSVIVRAFERRRVFATPVAEYLPPRLCRGPLAIIGDAAHVVSPVTGQGFLGGIGDAAVLAECLVHHAGSSDRAIPAALAAYENRRLPVARALVSASQQWSQAFVGRWTSAKK